MGDGYRDHGNVCILALGFYPFDLRVKRRAEALAEDGFSVHVICLRDDGEANHEIVEGVQVHRLPLRRRSPEYRRGRIWSYLFDYNAFFVLAALKLMTLDIKNGFRAIQVNSPPDYLVAAALIPKLAGAKIVLDMRDPMPELFDTLFDGWYRRPFVDALELIEKLALKFADRALTVTRETRDNCGGRGADVNEIAVVVNVPDDRLYRPDRYGHLTEKIDRIKKEERRAGKFRVVCRSQGGSSRGVDLVVRAAARLKDDIPGVEFRCIGAGDCAPAPEALASSLKVQDRVTFLGSIPFENEIEEILTADAAVVPVKKNPYSVLVHPPEMYEYLALQKTVVTSRLDSIAAYFPEDSMVFFEPGSDTDLADKLRYVFTYPEDMAARVERCSQIYETYRWEREKRKYLGVYHSLLSS